MNLLDRVNAMYTVQEGLELIPPISRPMHLTIHSQDAAALLDDSLCVRAHDAEERESKQGNLRKLTYVANAG